MSNMSETINNPTVLSLLTWIKIIYKVFWELKQCFSSIKVMQLKRKNPVFPLLAIWNESFLKLGTIAGIQFRTSAYQIPIADTMPFRYYKVLLILPALSIDIFKVQTPHFETDKHSLWIKMESQNLCSDSSSFLQGNKGKCVSIKLSPFNVFWTQLCKTAHLHKAAGFWDPVEQASHCVIHPGAESCRANELSCSLFPCRCFSRSTILIQTLPCQA